jgi:hypothetical protein
MKNYYKLLFILFIVCQHIAAQTVTIQVDASKGKKTISPYIYGKNNNISDNPGSPMSYSQWKLMRDAGLRFTRENGGNNASKYNWRLKLSCHPDWYNNIYAHNWDYAAKKLGDSMPSTQGMWAFQLIGKAASNTSNNFDDWSYNGSNWWSGVNQNLAGGGVPNGAGGSTATTEGNPNLYLKNWPADSTVAILDHWFGTGGLGLDKNKIKYWSMDNEPDIWNGTHDDVMKTQPAAEAFMQLYFAVAKKARAKYPNIKLTGPVPASEWQWYSWNNSKITVGGKDYVWLEFFIKRCAEEQIASGIKLLDVIDIHSYPGETRDSDIVQLHRLYFDSTYVYPGANGVKTTSPSGWDNTINKEYVFGRCNKWLTQYMGPNHGVTCAVSEYGFTNNSANVTATSYSSVLGTFADNGVEFFTPWYWFPGMWETMHLYSRYAKTTRVQSTSSQDRYVSAYSSINTPGDSMTVILVNRSLTASKNTTVNLAGFGVTNGSYNTLSINQLPSTETFVSHTSNALKPSTVSVTSNSFTMSLPALSTTAVILKGQLITGINEIPDNVLKATLYPNPIDGENAFIDFSNEKLSNFKVELFNMLGEVVYSKTYAGAAGPVIEIPCGDVKQGVYLISVLCADGKKWTSRFVKL